MRLFISINVPPELHNHCRQLQKRFPGMRNVDEFHLTLQFLGDDIGEQFLPQLTEALKSIVFQPFEIKLGQPRRFPNENRPNGVWIDCDGGEALKDLANRIRKIMDKIGLKPDMPFLAHITLGRYKKAPPELKSRGRATATVRHAGSGGEIVHGGPILSDGKPPDTSGGGA